MRSLGQILRRRRPKGPPPLELTTEMLAGRPRARPGKVYTADGDTESKLSDLSKEVEQVASYVTRLRREIGALQPSELVRDRLPSVRGDIDEVQGAIRSATDRIMSAAETLIRADMSGQAFRETLNAKLTEIIEACSVQDLAGQRISRVTSTLDQVANRLERFVECVKVPDAPAVYDREAIIAEARREVLMVEGPGSGSGVVEQTDIDQMFD